MITSLGEFLMPLWQPFYVAEELMSKAQFDRYTKKQLEKDWLTVCQILMLKNQFKKRMSLLPNVLMHGFIIQVMA